jgi:hypothetical protein
VQLLTASGSPASPLKPCLKVLPTPKIRQVEQIKTHIQLPNIQTFSRQSSLKALALTLSVYAFTATVEPTEFDYRVFFSRLLTH